MPFQERTVSAGDGTKLYVRDYAPGPKAQPGDPAVLCLGGLTRNSKDFARPAAWLSERYRVLCPDYRGRGRSEYALNPLSYRPETYVDDIRHLLIALGAHGVVVIGTSLGGLLGLGLATALPGCIRGLVMNDVGPEVPTTGLEPILAYVANPGRYADWEAAVEVLKAQFPDLPAHNDADWREIAENTFRRAADGKLEPDWDPALATALARQSGARHDYWHYFSAAAHLPLGLIRGAKSDILSPEIAAAMRERRPDAAYTEIMDVGHAPSLKETASIQVIEQVMNRVVSPEG